MPLEKRIFLVVSRQSPNLAVVLVRPQSEMLVVVLSSNTCSDFIFDYLVTKLKCPNHSVILSNIFNYNTPEKHNYDRNLHRSSIILLITEGIYPCFSTVNLCRVLWMNLSQHEGDKQGIFTCITPPPIVCSLLCRNS